MPRCDRQRSSIRHGCGPRPTSPCHIPSSPSRRSTPQPRKSGRNSFEALPINTWLLFFFLPDSLGSSSEAITSRSPLPFCHRQGRASSTATRPICLNCRRSRQRSRERTDTTADDGVRLTVHCRRALPGGGPTLFDSRIKEKSFWIRFQTKFSTNIQIRKCYLSPSLYWIQSTERNRQFIAFCQIFVITIFFIPLVMNVGYVSKYKFSNTPYIKLHGFSANKQYNYNLTIQ